jgi:hypothetical protein
MRRVLLVLWIMLASSAPSRVAFAGCWTQFWQRFRLDYQRMKCWPEPFLHADREAVRPPIRAMANNGWRSQNTLGDHFFEPETQQLTRAGVLKVRWIVTETPLSRRTVFVLKGESQEATSTRLDSVQQAVARIVTEGPMPPVLLTDVAPRGGPGEYFDQVDRAYKSSMPPPRLSPSQGGSTSGSGSGSGP